MRWTRARIVPLLLGAAVVGTVVAPAATATAGRAPAAVTSQWSIETARDAVTVSWPRVTGAVDYLVDDGSTRRTTSAPEVSVTGLEPVTAVALRIVARSATGARLWSGDVSTRTRGTTGTRHSISVASWDTGSFVTWDAIADARLYTVSVDGVRALRTPATRAFVAQPLEDGQTVSVVTDLPGLRRAEVGTMASYLPSAPTRLTAAAGALPDGTLYQSSYTYTTFIANQYVPVPDWYTCSGASNSNYFGGDNRGFSATSSRFRTRAHINVLWRDPVSGETLTGWNYSRSVGTTREYRRNADGTYTQVRYATASANGIYVEQTRRTISEASFRIAHSVGNPLCYNFTPSIDYSAQLALDRTNVWNAWGSRDRAPHHEAYLRQYRQNRTTVLRAIIQDPNDGFQYLAAGYPNTSYSLYGTA